MEIIIVKEKISQDELKKLAQSGFGDIIKGAVDLKEKILALGGELHFDAQERLIESGSESRDIWGFNIYPDYQNDRRIEFISLINIRPSAGNRSMEIQSPEIKTRITKIVDNLIE